MGFAIRFVSIAGAMAAASCGESSPTLPPPTPEEIVRERIAAVRDATAVLQRITDRASAVREAAHLKDRYERMAAANRRFANIRELGDETVRADFNRVLLKHTVELMHALEVWENEHCRVRDDPETSAVLREADSRPPAYEEILDGAVSQRPR